MLWEGGRNLGKASQDKRPRAKASAAQTDGASQCQQSQDRPRHCLPEVALASSRSAIRSATQHRPTEHDVPAQSLGVWDQE